MTQARPACWDWPLAIPWEHIPDDDQLAEMVDLLPDADRDDLARIAKRGAHFQRAGRADPIMQLEDWHAGRCGFCGTTLGDLVLDHDHRTGLVRGYLCTSCNIQEGHDRSNGGDTFDHWRRRPPITMLGLPSMRYLGFGNAEPGEALEPPPETPIEQDNAVRFLGL